MQPLVSILMPAYNGAKTLHFSIQSALKQDYPNKEIILRDDASKDKTASIAMEYPIKVNFNASNRGLGQNMTALMKESKGKYVIYLCQDDVFTNPKVISDMVSIFENNALLGVLGRYYYQYFDGYKGPVMVIRSDIYLSSCQPSGIMFRKEAMTGEFSNRLFVEMPSMIKNVLGSYWRGDILRYDTIAARLHNNNAATNASYFAFGRTQSQTLNWYEVCGKTFIYPMYFVQLKNRYPAMLIDEIKTCLKVSPWSIINPGFIFCALVALIVPSKILIHLSRFYRHRITHLFVREITREDYYGE